MFEKQYKFFNRLLGDPPMSSPEITCYDPYSLLHDLNNRFACPCHDQTVIYKVPGGSFKVKVDVNKSSEIISGIVSRTAIDVYQIGNQLYAVPSNKKITIEVQGKATTSKMSLEKEGSKTHIKDFKKAIKLFKNLYNMKWNDKPYPFPKSHEEGEHAKELDHEPREYFSLKPQMGISVKN